MTVNLKLYPAYKPSGVEWLGDVPEHWEVRRLKSFTDDVLEWTARSRATGLVVALEHVESWTGRVRLSSQMRKMVYDSQLKRFRAGDVLFEEGAAADRF